MELPTNIEELLKMSLVNLVLLVAGFAAGTAWGIMLGKVKTQNRFEEYRQKVIKKLNALTEELKRAKGEAGLADKERVDMCVKYNTLLEKYNQRPQAHTDEGSRK